MRSQVCFSIRESFLTYLSEYTVAHDSDGDCVLTVPINTIDNRWVDVTVEDLGNGVYRVHDAGKASDELFLQGVPLSDKKFDVMQLIANRYAVHVDNGSFMLECKAEDIQHSISAVAHSSAMAMTELIRHRPSQEDETVKSEVGKIIYEWGTQHKYRVVRDLEVAGDTTDHKFDFLVADELHHVAVNVLNPGQNSLARAQRYGFQGFDLAHNYATYKNLAVLANPQVWSQNARGIVTKIASRTIDFSATAPEEIFGSMDALVNEAVS